MKINDVRLIYTLKVKHITSPAAYRHTLQVNDGGGIKQHVCIICVGESTHASIPAHVPSPKL